METERRSDVRTLILERCWKMEATLLRLRHDARTAHCTRARAIAEALAALEAVLFDGWDSEAALETPAVARWLMVSQYLYDLDVAPVVTSAVWWRLGMECR